LIGLKFKNKMIKNTSRLLIIVAVVIASIAVWEWGKNLFSFSPKFGSSHTLILQETQRMGKLELAKFAFKDAVEHEMQIDYLPNPKVLLLVQGEAIGCIDLTKIEEKNIETIGDSLIITLPKPEVCNFKIDHSKSKIYDASLTFMNEETMIGEAYKQAEQKIQESALQLGILEQTKNNAQLVLKPLFENISGKKVRLKFI
jgi:hypothetical protein